MKLSYMRYDNCERKNKNALIRLAQMDEEKNKLNHGLSFLNAKIIDQKQQSCDNRSKHLVTRRKQNPKTWE